MLVSCLVQCTIAQSTNPNDLTENRNLLFTQILLNTNQLNCKFSPENRDAVKTLSEITVECISVLRLLETEELTRLKEKFNLNIESSSKIKLVPILPIQNSNIDINFSFLSDTNGRKLANPIYQITVDSESPSVVSEFGTKLVGVDDFRKGFIELEFSEPMIGQTEVGNYSISGDGGSDLVISDVSTLDGNKIRMFLLGSVNRNGGEILININRVTDRAGNGLLSSSLKINLIGAKIVSNLVQGRRNHTSIFYNGKIYTFGGRSTNSAATALNTLEIFNVNTYQIEKTLTWSVGVAPALFLHRAILLSNNNILIVGGVNSSNTSLSTSFTFDPETEVFAVGPNLTGTRRDFLVFSNGTDHYLIGGAGTVSDRIERYSEVSNTFTSVFTMARSRTVNASICSFDGTTFSVFGGVTGLGSTDVIETFNINTSATTASSSIDFIGNLVCKLKTNEFRFAGQSNTAQIWNPSLTIKTSEFTMEQPSRSGFSSYSYNDDQDILFGGLIGSNVSDNIELIDWEKKVSRQIAKLNYPKSSGTLVKIPNQNRVFYIGGQYSNASYNTIEEIKW